MDLASLRGSAEDLEVTARHALVAPVLSTPPPALKCDNQRLPIHRPKGGPLRRADIRKVVLISGASRGIGLETALHFARAGASLTIVARKQEALDASRDTILRERPSSQVLTFPADVRDIKKAEEAVPATVAHYDHLDILVVNAAILRPSFQRAFPA